MKKIIYFSCMVFAFACGSTKEKKQTVELNPEKQMRVVATLIVTPETSCGLYLTFKQDEKEVKIIPNYLDDRFRKNGMRLRFDYTEVGFSKECHCKIVELEEVSPLRGN